MNRNHAPAPGAPVRVVHVVESLDVGGLERLLVDFARHTDRARFALSVVTLGDRGRLADEFEALGWPVRALHARPGVKPGSILRLARAFRRDGVDVVHTHSEGPLLYGVTAARLAGVRRVIHTRHHGPDLGTPPRVLAVVRWLTRWVDRVVCVADDGVRHGTSEGLAAGKLLTVWNGIDLDRFAYTGPAPGGPAVIVARLVPEKDHATLLKAVARVVSEEPGFRLEIAGDGPCRFALEEQCRALKLGDAVRFLGEVGDVPALLGRAGLLVLSSVKEGISLTLLEAMARGLPVVATRVGGNPEVVSEGETGLLVPAGSSDDLAAALLAVYRDAEAGRRMGRAGRERAERCFDVRRTVDRYQRLYLGERDGMALREECGLPSPLTKGGLRGVSGPAGGPSAAPTPPTPPLQGGESKGAAANEGAALP